MKDLKDKLQFNKKTGFVCLIMCLTLFLTMILPNGKNSDIAQADTENQVKTEISNVKKEQSDVKRKKEKVVNDILSLQHKVDGLTREYNNTIEYIVTTENNIKKKQKEMAEQKENLNERLRVMYKNGSVGFVDVVLGSNSISELVSNIEIIKKIYKNDVRVLKLLKREHVKLKKLKIELNKKKLSLVKQKEKLEVEKEKLAAKKKELEKEELQLQKEANQLTAQLKAIMDAKTKYVGGALGWPVPSSHYISSPFGNRQHPILGQYMFHSGIDIAAGTGTTIVAAGNGTVILSSWYGGYGNCLIIDHGGGIATLYGHCNSLSVGVGAQVKRGQAVATVGSTGRSTGPHLHFEVRKNGEYVNPMGYLQ